VDAILAISTTDAQVIASVVLVVITAIAAVFALLAVFEARRTRKQQVRPVLALDLVTVEQSFYVEVGIVNVGQGSALDADLELAFHPSKAGADPVRHPWTLAADPPRAALPVRPAQGPRGRQAPPNPPSHRRLSYR
jgi:hypothetical protein